MMRRKWAERPTIGVTGPDRGGFPAWVATHFALWRAGARAVRVTPRRPVNPEALHGLVVGGGADISNPSALEEEIPEPPSDRGRLKRITGLALAPLLFLTRALFAARPHGIDAARDALEFELLEQARRRGLPVLGICRGAQLMNLSEGGSLLRNVSSFYTERPQLYTTLPRRDVNILEGSRLAATLGVEHARVNSLHFHAVDVPGKSIRIVAREPSGVNQAIEHTERRFWLGVQWHPEYLPQLKVQQRLFVALACEACSERDSHKATAGKVRHGGPLGRCPSLSTP